MGDSYSSGEGTYGNNDPGSIPYYPETATATNRCHRSDGAYGPLLSEQHALPEGALLQKTDFVACSGATITQMENRNNGELPQIDALDDGVGTVILTLSFPRSGGHRT